MCLLLLLQLAQPIPPALREGLLNEHQGLNCWHLLPPGSWLVGCGVPWHGGCPGLIPSMGCRGKEPTASGIGSRAELGRQR